MTSHAGSLLIARPPLRDPFFTRSVVLLLQHGPDGAFGLVLNRPAQVPDLPFPVFVGGPCKIDGLLMIHGERPWLANPDHPDGEVCPGVYLGNSDCFERVAANEALPTWKFRVFTGYAGWGAGQLEGELDAGAWIVLPAQGEVIFTTDPEELWEKLAPPTIPGPSMN